jgi:LPXTG-site transpeptidase (sortase) family protein
VRRSFISTDRVARTVAVLLALIAVASVTTAWLIQHHSAQQQADVSANLPQSLRSPSHSVFSAPPAGAGVPATSHQTGSSGTTAAHKAGEKAKAKRAKLIVHPIVPGHLFVPAIGVNTTVKPKPTERAMDPFLDKIVPSFGVPDDMYTTTWWASGPKPGARGMAVVLGHTQIGGYGVFNKLGKLKPGQAVGLTHGTTTLKFSVLSVHTGISKKDPTALQTVLANHPASARLALLTCSGNFNQGFRESAENTVVFARLVSVSH